VESSGGTACRRSSDPSNRRPAPRSGRGGRRFKSCHSDQYLPDNSGCFATPCATPCEFALLAAAPLDPGQRLRGQGGPRPYRRREAFNGRRSGGKFEFGRRLTLGIAALALYAAWVWLPTEAPRAPEVLRGSLGPEDAPAEATAAITAPGSKLIPPPWFSP
jgi:hypothetical protein